MKSQQRQRQQPKQQQQQGQRDRELEQEAKTAEILLAAARRADAQAQDPVLQDINATLRCNPRAANMQGGAAAAVDKVSEG